MENVYIDLGDDMTIGSGDSMVIGEDNLLSESEALVGPQGPPGPKGEDGFSPIATVTQNVGSATITITDATTTSSATVYDGTDGVDGAAASVTVGSTTTGEPGTQASVTNSGTSSAAVLDFVIPKGAKGDQGEQGDAATVDVGTIVAIAPDATPLVTNSGTVHDAILNFAIPQGYDGFSPVATVTQNTGSATISITDENGTTTATVYDGQDGAPGQTGPAGQDGAAATIAVGTTTTGNPGTNASVTNSGTSSAAVFNFTIPRGADGQNGTNGTDGADGFSPIATVTQNTGSATISITDANGTTTATVNDGATGATGATGPQGPAGPMGPGRLVYLGKINALASTYGPAKMVISSSPEYQNTTYCQYNSDGTIHINKAGTYMLWAASRINDTSSAGNIAFNFSFDGTPGDKGNWIIKSDIRRLTCNATMFKTLSTSDTVTIGIYVDGASISFQAGDIALMYVGDN